MPVIKQVEIWYPRLSADRPTQYKGMGPRTWNLQLRTYDKKEADRWKKEYGMKITPEENEEGKIYYRAKLSRKAYAPVADSKGQVDDLDRPKDPPSVIMKNGEKLDPYSIGNGSIADVAFSVYTPPNSEEVFRTLITVAVKKLIRRQVRESDTEIELDDDIEIVDEEEDVTNDDPF
jgi:hypothetical protein